MRRFYVESLPEVGRPFVLSGDEAHHMLDVVRMRVGDEVVLFDGSGAVVHARVVAAQRGRATLEILHRQELNVEPARRLTIACAQPRPGRMDFLIEKCSELGLSRLIPLVTGRSVTAPLEGRQNQLLRWRRIAIEAAKQSGRTRLTQIGPALSFQTALEMERGESVRIIATPTPDAVSLGSFSAGLSQHQPVLVLIGPEGGFTPEEEASARAHGFIPISLGPRILRVETAAIAVAARLLLD